MTHENESLCPEIRAALLEEGHAFPVTPEEVEKMEAIFEAEGVPSLPDELQAQKIADSLTYPSGDKIARFTSPGLGAKIATGLARAARNGEGEGIPENILERMHQDKAKDEPGAK